MPNNVPLPLSIFGESLFVIADPIESGNEGKRKKEKDSPAAVSTREKSAVCLKTLQLETE